MYTTHWLRSRSQLQGHSWQNGREDVTSFLTRWHPRPQVPTRRTTSPGDFTPPTPCRRHAQVPDPALERVEIRRSHVTTQAEVAPQPKIFLSESEMSKSTGVIPKLRPFSSLRSLTQQFTNLWCYPYFDNYTIAKFEMTHIERGWHLLNENDTCWMWMTHIDWKRHILNGKETYWMGMTHNEWEWHILNGNDTYWMGMTHIKWE